MEETPLLLILAIIIGFPIFFGMIWSFVIFIIANVGGWRRLAQRYRAKRPFNGKKLRFQSARFNWASYSGVLEVGADHEGLHLQPFFPYRPFHPALFIPWYDIQVEEGQVLVFDVVKLTFSSVPSVRLTLYPRTFEKIEPYMKGEKTGWQVR